MHFSHLIHEDRELRTMDEETSELRGIPSSAVQDEEDKEDV